MKSSSLFIKIVRGIRKYKIGQWLVDYFGPTGRMKRQIKKIEQLKKKYDTSNLLFDMEGTYIVNHIGGKFLLSSDMYYYVIKNKREEATNKLILSYVNNGGRIIDVGAHIGEFAINSGLLAKSKNIADFKIICFEPSEEIFQLLSHNVKKNKVSKFIKLEKYALSNSKGEGYLTLNKFGGNHLLPDNKNEKGETISSTTLDSYFKDNDIDEISLIKVDIEGYELDFLEGATTTIQKYKPDIILEIADHNLVRRGLDHTHIFNYMITLGYECSAVLDGEKTLEYHGYIDVERACNYFFKIQ